MSFLDTLKAGALDALHSTANALHAQLAAALMLAGHDVTPDDHIDTLTQVAAQAGNAGKVTATGATPGTIAPNYADFALATFSHSMTAALVQFAQAHLPEKFQPVAAQAVDTVADALADGKVTTGEALDAAVKIGAAAASAASPTGAAIVAVAEPLVESVVDVVKSTISTSANQSGV